jgi:hypothetical protein
MNPGPSQYNPNDTVVRLSSPKYKISSSSQFILPREQVPGPGSYQVKSRLGLESPKYTHGERRKADSRNMNPGPGQYTIQENIVREHSPESTFPKAERG